jgi:hypothetical protein
VLVQGYRGLPHALLDVHAANVIMAGMITPDGCACRLWRPMAYLGLHLAGPDADDSNKRNFLKEQWKSGFRIDRFAIDQLMR